MKQVFSSMQNLLQKSQLKYVKTIEISRGDSAEVVSFFVDMEKIFGSESTINELEEYDSDTDESVYNHQFMDNLKDHELNYAKKNSKKGGNKSTEPYASKFKSSYTKNHLKQGKIKPLIEITKSKPIKALQFIIKLFLLTI